MQKFSKKSSLALTLCILSAISSSGYAAEKDSLHQYNLDEYVVTATRTALTLIAPTFWISALVITSTLCGTSFCVSAVLVAVTDRKSVV